MNPLDPARLAAIREVRDYFQTYGAPNTADAIEQQFPEAFRGER